MRVSVRRYCRTGTPRKPDYIPIFRLPQVSDEKWRAIAARQQSRQGRDFHGIS